MYTDVNFDDGCKNTRFVNSCERRNNLNKIIEINFAKNIEIIILGIDLKCEFFSLLSKLLQYNYFVIIFT